MLRAIIVYLRKKRVDRLENRYNKIWARIDYLRRLIEIDEIF